MISHRRCDGRMPVQKYKKGGVSFALYRAGKFNGLFYSHNFGQNHTQFSRLAAVWLAACGINAEKRIRNRIVRITSSCTPANPCCQLYVLGTHFCPIRLPLRGFTSICRRFVLVISKIKICKQSMTMRQRLFFQP